jgi:bacteriorhodopsin
MALSQLWFGIGTALFAIATLAFLAFALLNDAPPTQYYLLPPLDTAIAGSAYLGMTLSAIGVLPVEVPIIRHLDWVLSTAVIVYYLGLVAGASMRARLILVVVDMSMIVLGVIAATLAGPLRWIPFAVSCVLLGVLVYMLTNTISDAAQENLTSLGTGSLFKSLRDLTVLIWLIYPVVWFLGIGLGLMTRADQNFVFMLLDITAKIGFMGIIVTRLYAVDTLRRTRGEGTLAAD